MSSANPLWGAPRIHGELLKLGIEVSQATVAKYMLRRRGTPSQNWRSFLSNHAQGIAAIDMFVVASASFRLLYVMIILAPRLKDYRERRRPQASDRSLALAPSDRSLSMGHGAPVFAAQPRRIVWQQRRWAVPMAWAYAAYVPFNLILFTIKTPQRWQSPAFGIVYLADRARRFLGFRDSAHSQKPALDLKPKATLGRCAVRVAA